MNDTLHQEGKLEVSEALKSKNDAYFAIMQTDGNFVVYSSSHFVPSNALWSTKTWDHGHQRPFHAIMQCDGNFVLYDSYHRAVWSSVTCFKGLPPHTLVMQDDGNLVIYDSYHKATWTSGTSR
jgi:hypothetical protein